MRDWKFSKEIGCRGHILPGSSLPMSSVEDASNDAAKQAITYMEKSQGKIPKDYNYERIVKPTQFESHRIGL